MSYAANGLELEGIAQQCRADFEGGRVTDGMLIELYDRYLPDQAGGLQFWLDRFRYAFPAQNCQFASVYLRHMVGYGKIIDGHYNFSPHSFLYVGETAIAHDTMLDITGDQFPKGPPVYVGPLVEPWGTQYVHMI